MDMNRTSFVMVLMLALVVGCRPEEPNNDDDNHILNGHEFVDLVLPSGMLWATCNVGADTPEDCGDYFAWGDTITKEMYDWKSYQYATWVDGRYELTKYCTDSSCGYNGFVDGLIVLEPVDDAVLANWGTGWRMPTAEEWDELYQNTTCVWTIQNDVCGRLLSASNGNSIFLPATGFRLDGELICTGLGVYWSSSLQYGCQVAAWSFHFDDVNCHVCGTYERSRGQCVRAVRCFQ
jgi:hypothetical protein